MTTAAEVNKQHEAKRQAAAADKQKSHADQRRAYLVEMLDEKVQQMFAIDADRDELAENKEILKAKIKESDKNNAEYQLLKEEMKALKERMEEARDQELMEKMAEFKAQQKALDSRAKALYDDLEVDGMSHNAFIDVHALARSAESERLKYEATRHLVWAAHGLETGEQLDWVKWMEESRTEH